AQGLADGSLSGTVSDASGAVLPGVTVTISNAKTEEQIATGEVGTYNFVALPAGEYVLTAQLPGFMTFRQGRIEIKPNQPLRQNITLSLGQIAETVIVSAAGRPKPTVPAGTPRRIRVGGNVIAAALVSQVKPVYPQTARD